MEQVEAIRVVLGMFGIGGLGVLWLIRLILREVRQASHEAFLTNHIIESQIILLDKKIDLYHNIQKHMVKLNTRATLVAMSELPPAERSERLCEIVNELNELFDMNIKEG